MGNKPIGQVQRARDSLEKLLEEAPEQEIFTQDKYRDIMSIALLAFVNIGVIFKGSFENYKNFVKQARRLGYEFPDIPLNTRDEDSPIYTNGEPIKRSKLSTALNIFDAYLSIQDLEQQVRQYRLLSLANEYMGEI